MNEISLSSLEIGDRGLLSGPYWGELRIFAEVARAKSFNRAAERLGLSQPTIGRKVRRLQDIIGAQLFITTKHGVRLTERGEELAAAVFRLDQSLFALASDLKARANDAEGLVSLSITDGLAAFVTAPALPAFTAAYPGIQLHIKSPGTLSNLRENGTDMMLTFAPIEAPDCVCRRLGTLHFIPIASKTYVARYGLPTRDRIKDHLLIQSHAYTGEGPVWRDWQALCADGQIVHTCDNSFAYGMLVRAGLGIGLLGTYVSGERDAVPLSLGVHAAVPMFAVALRERLEAKPANVVFEWLCATFGEANPYFERQLTLGEAPRPPDGAGDAFRSR
jgi:DNA-binding transcriptional LysR family regulator